MAILAGGWKLIGCVIRIRCTVIIGLVAAYTSVWRIVIIAMVAGSAVIRDAGMRPKQWVVIVMDREACRFPARCGSMTHRTIRRDGQRDVVGIQARIVIRGMTTRTGIWGVIVISVVTGITVICNRYVRPGEWIDGTVIKC